MHGLKLMREVRGSRQGARRLFGGDYYALFALKLLVAAEYILYILLGVLVVVGEDVYLDFGAGS